MSVSAYLRRSRTVCVYLFRKKNVELLITNLYVWVPAVPTHAQYWK